MEKVYWVYMLLCENNSYYTGYTNDLAKRYHEHRTGTGKCKYTRSFKPTMMVQGWSVKHSKSLAMKLESAIKKLQKSKKESLIAAPKTLSKDKRVKPVTKQILRAVNKR